MYSNDCKLKALVLQALLPAPLMSRDIFDSILHNNYNSFRVSLNKYCKQGYVQMQGKKPYHYSLTETGKLHAHNPYICRERFANKLNAIVSRYGTDIGMDVAVQYLSGDEKAKKQIEEYLKTLQDDKPEIVETVQKVIEVMPVPQIIKPIDDDYGEQRVLSYEELLKGNELANTKIGELNNEVNRLRNQQITRNIQVEKRTVAPKELAKEQMTPPKKNVPSDDMINRFELINDWQKKYLKKSFFDALGYYYPYVITASSNVRELMKMKLKAGDVVIYDTRTAATMLQNNFCRELNAKEVLSCRFHIERKAGGIYVASELPGVKACRIMKRLEFERCRSVEKKRV
ncbi:hypothetical protein HNV12_20890 [Methanococcoides sp. SA1]|nr:hypothetical protein [Methanococcoides sp. SA1]